MKKIIAICLVVFIAGCAYEGTKISTYVDNPGTLLEDPLSVKHQQAMDDLESSYLQKKITYAEYLEQKRGLEDDYQSKVRARRDIVENTDYR